jgi:uncharacterized protein (TIGR02284 family)
MSIDDRAIRELVLTLEDGKAGFASGAQRVEATAPEVAELFRQYSEERAQFADELRRLALDHREAIGETGTLGAAFHRGWMALKDTLHGHHDPHAVIEVVGQGEDHAVHEYRKVLKMDLTADLRRVVRRQADAVIAAHDRVIDLRDHHVTA